MAKRIAFIEEKCTHCNLCAMYCSLAFSEKGAYDFRPTRARIRISANKDDTKYAAHVCLQCESPACLEACPEGALLKADDTGIIEVNEALCTGCGRCVKACEYDCIFLFNKVAVKCEICYEPLCVRACARGALELVDDDDVAEQAALYKEVRI